MDGLGEGIQAFVDFLAVVAILAAVGIILVIYLRLAKPELKSRAWFKLMTFAVSLLGGILVIGAILMLIGRS